MKLTSVELHPAGSSEEVVLSFRDPSSANPYAVKGIVGLDADEITARYYGGSGTSKFYNPTVEKRDVVIQMGLNPRYDQDESYSGLRDQVYRMVASSRTGKVQIQFKNGTDIIAAVTGSISKIETPQFEKEQQVTVTINCDDPILRSTGYYAGPDAGDGLNELYVINDDLSTAPHGFIFQATFVNPLASFKIEDPDNLWHFETVPPDGFLVGDEIVFSSDSKQRQIFQNRGGIFLRHLADTVLPGSYWPIIFPGSNTYHIDNKDDLTVDTILYQTAYWGV